MQQLSFVEFQSLIPDSGEPSPSEAVDPTVLKRRRERGLPSHSPTKANVRHKTDFYVTPPKLARQLVGVARDIGLFTGDVLDVGAGTGVWGYAYRSVVGNDPQIDGIEIASHEKPEPYRTWYHADFIEWNPPVQYTTVIGNPPFYTANYLVPFCLRIGVRYAAFLLRLSVLASNTRVVSFWQQGYAPRWVYVLDKRPMFNPYRGTFSFDVAFFVWDFSTKTYETTARFMKADIGEHADLTPFYQGPIVDMKKVDRTNDVETDDGEK